MVMATGIPQGQRVNPRFTLEVTPGMSITNAIANADALGGDWTILVYPGTYDEGDLTPNGGANITIKGMGEGRVTIAPTVAPAIAVIVSAHTLNIEDIIVTAPTAAFPAVRVTAGTFEATSCELNGDTIGDAVQQVGGTVILHDCQVPVGDIDLRDAACTLTLTDCDINGTLDTSDGAGANVLMTVAVKHCDCHDQAFNLAATGACVYDFHSNNEMGTITDASLGIGAVNGQIRRCHVAAGGLVKNGTTGWLIDNSELALINSTNATGEISVYGGIVVSITRAVGSVVWWLDGNTLKVIPSGTITDTIIQWAVNAAGAGDTVVIHPGTYEEAVTLAAGINLVGVDKEQCIIDVDHADLITMAEGCAISNLTLDVTCDATASGNGVECNDANCTIEDINIVLHRSDGPYATGISENTSDTARTIYIRNVRIRMSDDTNERGIFIGQANKTVYVENSWIQGSDYGMAIGISGGAVIASTIHSHSNYLEASSAKSRSVYNNGGLIYLKNDAVAYGILCEGDGGAVRMRNTSYKSIHRTGTGNIVDESPDLKDAPWHIERWTWQAALANAQVAVRGVPLDAGSGQVIIETLDSGAGVMAVETSPELARALGNELTPARTPRFLTQISAHTDDGSGVGNPAFDPHVAMFFGLRHSLGPALPAHPEHHAGFIWTGAAFNASSNDGAATQTTALTTPSDDVQHQLEVIVFGGVTTVGWVEFYVDGVLVATHVTRIPVDVLDWQHLIIGLGTGGGDTISVTVRPGGCQECPA